MEDIDGILEFLEETPTGYMCCWCMNEYNVSLDSIKWHLAKIEGHGIDICSKIDDEEFIKRLREDYCYPKPPPTRKRASISTVVPSRKRGSNGAARNVVTNVKTLGVRLLATEVVDKQFDECVEDIWSCLMDDDDDVFSIGIYGKCGIGKTEVAKCINNKLLQTPNKFHYVFWVDMSPQYWSIFNLQSHISKVVGVDLSNGHSEIKRAAQLSKGLAEKKKSFLILDDVWDYISLQEVGIPLGVDLCTVLFTTRSLRVCKQLGCQRKIEIRCLLPHEGYELFKRILGRKQHFQKRLKLCQD